MVGNFEDSGGRKPRRTVTYQGLSSTYFGFTEFDVDRPLPHAAGIYMLGSDTIGPERWQIILVGEAADVAADILRNPAAQEARRRGAKRVLLHVCPLDQPRRRQAATDLWMAQRTPLVSWETDQPRLTA